MTAPTDVFHHRRASAEFLYLKEFESIEHFKQELSKYIIYYNHKRIKEKLIGMSPVQYRTHAQQVA